MLWDEFPGFQPERSFDGCDATAVPGVFVSFIRLKDKTGVSELYKCREQSNSFLTRSYLN